MKASEIKKIYEKLSKKNYGCEYYKMDLHIHTPASKCYKETFKNMEDEYEAILKEAYNNDIHIISITDHNTVKGYFDMIDILSKNKNRFYKYNKILILPGIEISCFNKHILAIFPPEKSKDELNNFLYNIGIEIGEQGEEYADAYKVTPLELMKQINQLGGVSLLAHADASNGMLEKLLHNGIAENEDWVHKGKSLAAIVKSEYLHGISLNDKNIKKKLVEDILRNKEYKRDSSIAILFFSDSHGTRDINGEYKADGKPIGTRYSYIKLSELSFHGLYIALLDPDVRIFDEIPCNKYPYIEGVAIKGGFIGLDSDKKETQLVRFNKALNCVIGARGTGKSTLLDIIQYTLYPLDDYSNVALRFDTSVVFLNYNNDVFAFVKNTKTQMDEYINEITDISKKATIFKKSSSGTFNYENKSKEILKELDDFSSVAYKQREIFNNAENKEGPTKVINDLLLIGNKDKYESLSLQILQKIENIHDELKRFEKFEWDDIIGSKIVMQEDIIGITRPIDEIQKLSLELHNLRGTIIEQINKILEGQVKLSISKVFRDCDNKVFTNRIVTACRNKHGLAYEEETLLRRRLMYIVEKTEKDNLKWLFLSYVLESNAKELAINFSIDEPAAEEIISLIRPILTRDIFTIFPEDIVEIEYNVNYGISRKERFLSRDKLSMGQKAVAMLLIVVTAAHDLGDNRPLIIDQPEDDLDNIYIYSSLVKEFRKIKNSRQLIFATHNPNIPIAGDAENIMILESDGSNGVVRSTGSIDKIGISKNVLNILEGGPKALALRNMKYPI